MEMKHDMTQQCDDISRLVAALRRGKEGDNVSLAHANLTGSKNEESVQLIQRVQIDVKI
jgi:hypothetical protein